jgi:multiple sugar transport system substrate-binding protein
MSDTISLTGMTWDHTRGFVPMVATSQRFSEIHPEVEITWQKRSLKAFGDQPIEELAAQFDFLVIDHPFVGFAASHPVILPLDQHLSASYLAEQAAGSVGASHPSYTYGGHHWGLAIDAATPVASWRADLLEQADASPPETWEELLSLARRGLIAVPAVPIDSLMNLYMLCLALGEDPFGDPERFAPTSGVEALTQLRELVLLCNPACFQRNPIRTYEALVSGQAAYCPFAYGYSNYARAGYAEHRLIFGGLVTYGGRALRSTLGGTGLAISAACRHRDIALEYARYVASPICQRTLFVASGGQPGHRSAWEDPDANAMTANFFRDTLPTLDDAYLRPRYNGYMHFQDQAAPIVQRFLREGGDAGEVIRELNSLYAEPRTKN